MPTIPKLLETATHARLAATPHCNVYLQQLAREHGVPRRAKVRDPLGQRDHGPLPEGARIGHAHPVHPEQLPGRPGPQRH